jgi:hypothetical protein
VLRRIVAAVKKAARGCKHFALMPGSVQAVRDLMDARSRELQESSAILAGLMRQFDAEYREQAGRLRQELRELKHQQADACAALAGEQQRQAAALQAIADALRVPQPDTDVLPIDGLAAVALGADACVHLDAERSRAGYLTVAPRPGPDVQVVAAAHRLPFPEGSLAEIAAGRLAERFTAEQLESVLLPHWKGLLRAGGVLRLECIHWDATVRALQAGEVGADDFTRALLAASPRSVWGPEALADLLRRHGFGRVEVVASDRPNGPWREAEVVGTVERPALRAAV